MTFCPRLKLPRPSEVSLHVLNLFILLNFLIIIFIYTNIQTKIFLDFYKEAKKCNIFPLFYTNMCKKVILIT